MISPVAIVGSGPAALMVASVLSDAGYPPIIFEKEKGPAKKLLIAGSTGLNITYDSPLKDFHLHYRSGQKIISHHLREFSPQSWLDFVNELGIETFLGSSRRYFVKGLKASSLLHAWLKKLKKQGTQFRYSTTIKNFTVEPDGVVILQTNRGCEKYAAVVFCLGGGSYQSQPLEWPKMFVDKNISFHDFQSSNAGFEVDWKKEFLEEAEGLPLKSIHFTSAIGSMRGDLMITHHGLEGTPVYSFGQPGNITLDLKPDLDEQAIVRKMSSGTENLSPLRRAKKYLNLCPASLALLYHHGDRAALLNVQSLSMLIKKFPLVLLKPRPLEEVISSSGGIALEELNDSLMLKKLPGVFLAGEMLDWDAPTGGFLIQACVSQGRAAGNGALSFLRDRVPLVNHF